MNTEDEYDEDELDELDNETEPDDEIMEEEVRATYEWGSD